MSKIKLISAKDISQMCDCSISTSYNIIKEIKSEFNIKRLTKYHLENYLFSNNNKNS